MNTDPTGFIGTGCHNASTSRIAAHDHRLAVTIRAGALQRQTLLFGVFLGDGDPHRTLVHTAADDVDPVAASHLHRLGAEWAFLADRVPSGRSDHPNKKCDSD